MNASYVSQYGRELVELLCPQAGERILDLGCGDGELAHAIARRGCHVQGADPSEAMVQAARARGIEAVLMSAEEMDFEQEFDAVFSNAALHWMKNADLVIANVYRALKPGGRFCAELGGKNNVETIVREIYRELDSRGLDADLYDPWYFPSKDEYSTKLEASGFTVKSAKLFERPTLLPTDVVGWLKTFAVPFLRDIAENEHEQFARNIAERVSSTLKNDAGQWFADYVRLRFVAEKV